MSNQDLSRVIRIDEKTRKADIIYIKDDIEAIRESIYCAGIDTRTIYNRDYCVICDDEGALDGRTFVAMLDGYSFYGNLIITKLTPYGSNTTMEDEDLLRLIGARIYASEQALYYIKKIKDQAQN